MNSLKDTIKKLKESEAKATATAQQNVAPIPLSMASNANDAEDTSFSRSENYKWYEEYSDTNVSSIDPVTKSIKLDSTQISITQESNSQVIPFEMNRYWEGIDISRMSLRIHYANKNKQEAFSTPVNVSFNDTTIRFIWLLDEYATQVAGDLMFEIMATGTNELGENYTWRTKPDGKMNVIDSLAGNGVIKPSDEWLTQYFKDIDARIAQANAAVAQAEEYASQAKTSEDTINDVVSNVQGDITTAVLKSFAEELKKYYTKTEIDDLIANIDISDALNEIQNQINNLDGLKNLIIDADEKGSFISFYNGKALIKTVTIDKTPSVEWVSTFKTTIETVINERVDATQSDLNTYKTATDVSLKTLSDKINDVDALSEQLSKNFYDKPAIEEKLLSKAEAKTVDKVANDLAVTDASVNAVEKNVASVEKTLVEIEDIIKNLSTEPGKEYDVALNEDKTMFQLIENGTVKTTVPWNTGGGGGTASSTITVGYITPASITSVKDDSVIIKYTFTSVDTAGDDTGDGTATWVVGNTTVATSTAIQGGNAFDITQYLGTGSQKIRLSVKDSYDNIQTKTWTVNVIDMYLESTFDDTLFYNGEISFRYTPYGDVPKTVHFVLDGTEIAGITTSVTGRQLTQSLPAQSHGSHLLDVYLTATVNDVEITSEHIYKDILWVDEHNSAPMIGCAITDFLAVQYNSMNIPYVVYNPTQSQADITLSVDGIVVSTLKVDRTKQIWNYKSTVVGSHTLVIACGETTKTIHATISALGIDIDQVITNLAFDFNPAGKSNNDADRLWTNRVYSMSVSDNFDWTNGGYQIDGDGNTYFCVKAGTTAMLDYKLFADDARKNGKNFKFIFKSTNVRNYDAKVLDCKSSGIGLSMNAQNAVLTSEQTTLDVPYVEDEVMEFEFNIRPDSEFREVITYEDGVPSRAKIYSESDNFTQSVPQTIMIGSDDCDVWVYRMKSYTMNLTDDEVIVNYIADGRDADTIISRYMENHILNANGELDADLLAEKCPRLRVIKISAPTFTTGKKNEVANTTVQHIFKNGDAVLDNWTATGSHKGQGTTSNQYGEAGRNIDISLKDGFVFGDGSTGSVYSMTRNSIGVNYFNIKVNIASSEAGNNALLQDEFNQYNPHRRQARINTPMVRDTLEFHPCVVFIQETDTVSATEFDDGKWHFYACGNLGNSKKNWQVLGNDPTNPLEVIIEVCNNTSDQNRFLSDDLASETWNGDTNYEFRYEMDGITDEQRTINIANWQKFLSWVVNASPEQFVAEFDDYCIRESCLYHYLFTEYHTMVDNRAKNTFWHTEDGIHWDLSFDYDNDTALGNNNEGDLVLTYGMEDVDQIGTKDVFNAADSKFFCYIRDYMQDAIDAMYRQIENDGGWDAERKIRKFDNWQNCSPARLWMLDMHRKYFRPYEDNGTTSYLEGMMYGRKRYQRRQFLRYQQPYMASKHMGSVCTSNTITMRGYTPTNWTGIKPNGDLDIVPYADMYIACMFGSHITHIRAKRGQTYHITNPVAQMNDTEMYIYTASQIQSLGNVSASYIGLCDIGKAVKLQELIVGSNVEGYINTNLTTFSTGNNILLEKLNLQNLPNLKHAINLSQCMNLFEFYAEGSGITGVLFASGGKLKTAHIPAVSSLTVKNLLYLADLEIESLDNLTTLVVENCSSVINVLEIIKTAPNINRVRFVGINWMLDDTTMLDKLLSMAGIDENNYNSAISVLEGTVHVPVMKQKKLDEYVAAWPGLEITYDTLVVQFTVTFINDDGTVLDIQYVDIGTDAVEPCTKEENPIDIPKKESTVSTEFTFSGWDTGFTGIFSDRRIKATYDEKLRMYTVKYISKGTVLQETRGEYGSSVNYTGNIPTYASEETAYVYYLFQKWDKSGYIDGDKTIHAIYDKFEYVDGCFDGIEFSSLRPVQIYGMTKAGKDTEYIDFKDSVAIPVGNDYSYADVEEKVLISEKTTFDGNNYIDTGIQLLDEDKDWVIAIDYKWDSSNTNNAVLAQCYQSDGSNGFKLWFSSQPRITWATASSYVASIMKRDIVILRHIRGENKLHVYKGNLPAETIEYTSLNNSRETIINSPLVFGCARADDGVYENHAKGVVYWCKLWYSDLGDDACRNLAIWTHENLTMEVSNFKKYYLSDNSGRRCSVSLLASHLLSNPMPLNSTTATTGGWALATLNAFLNSRFYHSIPTEWRQLLKQVKISSTTGDKSSELSTSNCYVSIPAVAELDSSMQYEPYSFEGDSIPYMVSNDNRIRRYEDGTAATYFTRSPNHAYNSYLYTCSETGEINPYSYGLYEQGVCIQLFF